MSTYAAELDDTDTVVRVIVGTAEWAADNLGGRWVDSPNKLGISWRSRRRGFIPWEQPLDASEALATLLAVRGVVSVREAADSVGLLPVDLVHEAQAWAAAAGMQATPGRMGRLRTWWHNRRTERNETQESES